MATETTLDTMATDKPVRAGDGSTIHSPDDLFLTAVTCGDDCPKNWHFTETIIDTSAGPVHVFTGKDKNRERTISVRNSSRHAGWKRAKKLAKRWKR